MEQHCGSKSQACSRRAIKIYETGSLGGLVVHSELFVCLCTLRDQHFRSCGRLALLLLKLNTLSNQAKADSKERKKANKSSFCSCCYYAANSAAALLPVPFRNLPDGAGVFACFLFDSLSGFDADANVVPDTLIADGGSRMPKLFAT